MSSFLLAAVTHDHRLRTTHVYYLTAPSSGVSRGSAASGPRQRLQGAPTARPFPAPKGHLPSLAGSTLPPASKPTVQHLQICFSVPCFCQHVTCLPLTLLPPSLSSKTAFTRPQGLDGAILGRLLLCLPRRRPCSTGAPTPSVSWPRVLCIQSLFWSETDLLA